MTTLTVRNLDPPLEDRLRIRAAQQGHSMEAEVRAILAVALTPGMTPAAAGRNLADRIQARFAPLGGVDLNLPPREPGRDPPRFD